ncbi:MAG: YicC family protein [Rhizobiaceae bacterium]|nr:YicC family protein [Rhizobiaceae bacterium]MCV0408116.1 YicC family protein [Rhizobiaceae bacterium]
MALQSMTGFGRAASVEDAAEIAWELKSVNGKGLEARLRLPSGFERLEQPVRQAFQRRFTRGNIQAALTVSRTDATVLPVVNETFLRDVAGLAQRLQEQFGVAPPTADGLLSLRGVLEVPESTEDEETRTALDRAILECLESALDQLVESRQSEGRSLHEVLRGHLDRIEELALKAEADPSREPASIRARLAEQVRLLLDAAPPLDEARLHQEAAYLAAKADIREEIDRLKAHVDAARSLLDAQGPVGRKLDFLAQEFNRESNTLCSKSNAAAVTAIGLDLKAVVDQFREQVQNLE